MCGKYVLIVVKHNERMLELINLCNRSGDRDQKIQTNAAFEITPGCNAPVLMRIDGKVTATSMKWGFEEDGRSLLINARSENLKERVMFKGIADTQRCALPAAGYFEWRDGDNLRHLITHECDNPIYLAGIYRSDRRGNFHFVVLTRESYGSHAKIHGRMPCIFYSREAARRWIFGAMPVEELYNSCDDPLKIEVQGVEQLRMDFHDQL